MRRIFLLLLLLLTVLAPAGCRKQPNGEIKVMTIGGAPKLRDPALGPLAGPDEVLLSNVAQGLVQFDAAGNIVPGLAERWNVSDDGLSYIFRIATAQWSDGRKVNAQQVARILNRYLSERSKDEYKDALGGVQNIVAMTDRVLEIELVAPRPNLLPLLAQPQFAILRNGSGSGPFRLAGVAKEPGTLRLTRDISAPDEETSRHDELMLSGATAPQALAAFDDQRVDVVLGGTFNDLPFVRRVKSARAGVRFDPASGLFGLMPTRSGGQLDRPALRKLLSQAIDRDGFVAALAVPGLGPRVTLLEVGLDGIPGIAIPSWTGVPVGNRIASLRASARAMFDGETMPTIRVALPRGPGGELLLQTLMRDWGALGFTVQWVSDPTSADFVLVDRVAPSSSPAWFVRRFRCGEAPVCTSKIDDLLETARTTPVPAQRYALLAQAARIIDDEQLFIPITAPVRWSLVSRRIVNFGGNRYARHTLTDLDQKPGADD